MQSTINKYQIHCVTENQTVSGYGTDLPTCCYNNTTHTVNLDTAQLLQIVDSSEISILQDLLPIKRNPHIANIVFTDVPPSSTVTIDYTYTIPVSMYSFYFISSENNKNDNLTIIGNPDTVIGYITADINTGITTIPAPSALMTHGSIGYSLVISISDNTNTENLGTIIAMDYVNSTVTIQNPTIYNYSYTNTVLKLSLKLFDNILIGPAGHYSFFDSKFCGNPIIQGSKALYKYTNNSSTDYKSLSIYLVELI